MAQRLVRNSKWKMQSFRSKFQIKSQKNFDFYNFKLLTLNF